MIDIICLEKYWININKSIYKDEAEEITQDINFEEIQWGEKRSSHKSIPGLDVFLYEIHNILVNYPRCKEIVEKVFNDALK